LGGWPSAFAAVLAVTTTGVLVGFQALCRPDTTELAAKLPLDWFGNLLLAGVVFSVANAALEELIFRGILWDVVADEWNELAALGVTAVLFGMVHLQGYPPGPLGALMAGLYGLGLGVLRWCTGGLGLATVCHVGADATIFCILAGT
jgi:membrane protease YdiL (CAAX protease family)